MGNFFNISQIPPINKTNAGEIVKVPFHYIPEHTKGETHISVIIILVLIGIILGIISGFLIYRSVDKINNQWVVYL